MRAVLLASVAVTVQVRNVFGMPEMYQMIYAPGRGWKLITGQLNHERVTICSPGMLEGAYLETLQWILQADVNLPGDGTFAYSVPGPKGGTVEVRSDA